MDLIASPDSLDPQFGYTPESVDELWLAYTGLLTYQHANGIAGTKIIPGLARSLPVISHGGTQYSLTLRHGLKFSNGAPVRASDFTYTIERAIKLNWGADSFFTSNIKGAAAYAAGKSKTISGISTNNHTGAIHITLTGPYGAFPNVLAFTAAGLVPQGTPMTVQNTNPPPGVGPYMIAHVKTNQSFELVKNPKFASMHLPGIPVGHLSTITFDTVSNPVTAAQAVLNNSADGWGPDAAIPGSVLGQVKSQAGARYKPHSVASTNYFFLNTKRKPFSSKLAREAISYAVNRRAIARLSSGFIAPGCYFFPPGIVGHLSGCLYTGSGGSDVAKAKQLVRESGLENYPVTVWGENSSPRSSFMAYYVSVLNSIGFKATPKLVNQSVYGTVIGSLKNNPQTGDGEWTQDFPNPSDFMPPLGSGGIPQTNNLDYSRIKPPPIAASLAKVPATKLSSVRSQWESVDRHVAEDADELVYGYQVDPEFVSNRIDLKTAVFSPIYLDDYSTWQLQGS